MILMLSKYAKVLAFYIHSQNTFVVLTFLFRKCDFLKFFSGCFIHVIITAANSFVIARQKNTCFFMNMMLTYCGIYGMYFTFLNYITNADYMLVMT